MVFCSLSRNPAIFLEDVHDLPQYIQAISVTLLF
jgi:hypothetical protein